MAKIIFLLLKHETVASQNLRSFSGFLTEFFIKKAAF